MLFYLTSYGLHSKPFMSPESFLKCSFSIPITMVFSEDFSKVLFYLHCTTYFRFLCIRHSSISVFWVSYMEKFLSLSFLTLVLQSSILIFIKSFQLFFFALVFFRFLRKIIFWTFIDLSLLSRYSKEINRNIICLQYFLSSRNVIERGQSKI